MNDALIQAMHAIDRLNSWVRSKSYSEGSTGGPRRAVYHMKRQAIVAAHRLSIPQNHMLIESVTQCRDCSGSGRYLPWWGGPLDHCYRCNSTGQARLRFIVSEYDGIRWHTPEHEFPLYDLK